MDGSAVAIRGRYRVALMVIDLLLGLCADFVLVAVNEDELVGSAVDGTVEVRLAIFQRSTVRASSIL